MIREPEFAERLERACQDHPHCPTELHRGKQKWLREKLTESFGPDFKTSPEAVRKWFAGETKPRRKFMRAISNILNVDEAWLYLGQVPDISQKEKKKRAHSIDGGVMLLAGLIQISGGHTTFPSPGSIDRSDLLAIIDGEAVELDAPLARPIQKDVHLFTIKRGYELRKVVGVVPNGFGANLILINHMVIELHGKRRGDYTEIEVSECDGKFFVGTDKLPDLTNLQLLTND